MKILSFMLFRFQLISSGAQLGSIGDLVALGVLLLFCFRSRTLIVFGCCNALFMYLCEVASVSQLCLFSLMYYMGCVKITSLATLLSMRLCL